MIQESELYYLQSRYYDPETGRFLNADAFASTGQGVLGNNMFAYCNNNSVNATDKNGKAPDTAAGWIGEEIGKFIYELITGEDHPSRETERIQTEIAKKQVDIVIEVLESDEFKDTMNSDGVKKLKGTFKIATGWKYIKRGGKMILAPLPTEVEDIAGVGLITYGIIRATFGVAEVIISFVRGDAE